MKETVLPKFRMKISSWNVRGLNDPLKQSEIKKFLRRNKVDIAGLVEVKVRLNKIEKVARKALPHWELCHNAGAVPRVWCGWNKRKLKGRLLHETPQCLTLEMEIIKSQKLFYFVSSVWIK